MNDENRIIAVVLITLIGICLLGLYFIFWAINVAYNTDKGPLALGVGLIGIVMFVMGFVAVYSKFVGEL